MQRYRKSSDRYMSKLETIFSVVEVDSVYLRKLLYQTISIIEKVTGNPELSFGFVREGKTFSGKAGEVIEDGHIILDPELLQKHEDDVVMAIIAHELAHYYLGHFNDFSGILQHEYQADEMARKWGFNIDKFRRVCGEPHI